MKILKKAGAFLAYLCVLSMFFSGNVYAASASVRVSGGSANVGSTVKMTCTATTSGTSIGGADISLRYDATALQPTSWSSDANATGGGVYYSGYASADGSTQLSFYVTFKVLKAGTHTVSIESADVYAFDSNVQLGSPSISNGTITGKTVSTDSDGTTSNGGGTTNNTTKKDTNNKLSALQVYPGSLSPAFNASTTSYNVTVPEDTTEMTISATPQSDKATVTVSGGKDLKLGLNTAQVVVIAENGSSCTYTITIMCGEKEQIQIDGTTKTIHEDFADDVIPTGFTRTKVTYNKRQYEALVNAAGNLYLMSLENEAGAGFYIYNYKTQEFYTFIQIIISEGKYIIPLPLNNEVKQFSGNETITLTVQEKKIDAWKLDEEFSVAYVMNQNGENALYRYDSVDGVFQRYTETALEVTDTTKKAMFPDKYYMYAVVGLGALCLILLVALIYFIASRKQRREGRKKKIERDAEKQRIAQEKELEKEKQREEKALEKQRLKEEKELEKQRRKEEKALAKENGEGGSKFVMWLMIILVLILVVVTVVVVLSFFGIGIDFAVVWGEIKNML